MTPLALAAAGAALAALAVLALGARRQREVQRVARAWRSAHPEGVTGIVSGAEPLVLAGGPRAVLMLHGFGDTPQSLAWQARALHARGFTVHVPLLPGHGRTLEAFIASDAAAWIDAAREHYLMLCRANHTVSIVGLSMGGALATALAAAAEQGARRPPPGDGWCAPRALVLLAPFLEVSMRARLLSACWPIWSLWRAWVPGRAEASIRDPGARARSLGYGVSSPRLLRELRRVVEQAAHAAPRLTPPTLMICSTADYRVTVEAARRGFERLGSAVKELRWVERSGHVISVDHDAELVHELMAHWLERHHPPR